MLVLVLLTLLSPQINMTFKIVIKIIIHGPFEKPFNFRFVLMIGYFKKT